MSWAQLKQIGQNSVDEGIQAIWHFQRKQGA